MAEEQMLVEAEAAYATALADWTTAQDVALADANVSSAITALAPPTPPATETNDEKAKREAARTRGENLLALPTMADADVCVAWSRREVRSGARWQLRGLRLMKVVERREERINEAVERADGIALAGDTVGAEMVSWVVDDDERVGVIKRGVEHDPEPSLGLAIEVLEPLGTRWRHEMRGKRAVSPPHERMHVRLCARCVFGEAFLDVGGAELHGMAGIVGC